MSAERAGRRLVLPALVLAALVLAACGPVVPPAPTTTTTTAPECRPLDGPVTRRWPPLPICDDMREEAR